MNLQNLKLALILGFSLTTLLASNSFAHTLSETFSSRTYFASGDMVWNQSLSRLHPGIQVYNWDLDGVAPFANLAIDVGDGRHGSFNSETYAQFSEGGDVSGQIIRLNTDTYPLLQVTDFALDAGWTLKPTGSNPLKIVSLSTIKIDGTIDCSGDAGEAGSADVTLQAAGGLARCGGANGGAGGTSVLNPQSGLNSGASVSGGSPGPLGNVSGGQGGGGGGGYPKATNPNQGVDGVNPAGGAGGGRGNSIANDSFSELAGGSGGGGGSAFTDAGDVPNHSSGGGGGAGGGVIYLAAIGNITVSASGSILANGGAGGGLAGSLKAGGGGGGAGGSIQIFSVGDIIFDGAVSAIQAAGGVSAGGNGGAGAGGRSWVVEKDGLAGGGVVENPDSGLVLPGQVHFLEGTFSAESKSIDSLNTAPLLISGSATSTLLSGATAQLYIAHAKTYDFTPQWVLASSLAGSELSRYIKFKIEFANVNRNQDSFVDSIELVVENKVATDFQLVSGCGRIQNKGDGLSVLFFILLILPLLFVIKKKFTNWRPNLRQLSFQNDSYPGH